MFGPGVANRRTWPAAAQAVEAALRLAFDSAGARVGAVVLATGAFEGSWEFVAGTRPADAETVRRIGSGLTGSDLGPQPVRVGDLTAFPLPGARRLLGALVLSSCDVARVAPDALADVLRCITDALDAAEFRTEAAFSEHASHAVRRLFAEGAHAVDVQSAGEVLARVAIDTFRTERAAMYVIDDDGLISFAISVGDNAGLSEALSASLVGKVAANSPMWRAIEDRQGPYLMDDASLVAMRPGGVVETLQLANFATIPLMSADGPLGMVVCGDTCGPRSWSRREHELAAQFSLEAALIVDAARLRTVQQTQLRQASHLAYHDGLTGLPNRRLLIERVEEALRRARVDGSTSSVLLLDLDDFKRVNDTLGHRYGDDLLCEVAARLRGTLAAADTLARLGGDEFAVVLAGDRDRNYALAVGTRIRAALAEPMTLQGIPVTAGASIGVAMLPGRAESAEDLLQHADIAMYAAKRSRTPAVVYDSSLNEATVDRLSLHAELRHAITGGELRLHYQPKLDLRRNVVTGVEALVRWQHPRRGLLGPADFLPLAESGELIHPLTAWVVEHSLRQQRAWAADGFDVDLAVNISARNLLDTELLARIGQMVRHGATSNQFVVEVTETAVMTNPEQGILALHEVRAAGAKISMDDFGTGQSSLALLSQLPVDELKIDRQLVSGVGGTAHARALVDMIVHLGHRLGLSVVGEGIETPETLTALRELGCDVGQGYLISPPVPPDECRALLTVPRLETVSDPYGAGPARLSS